MPLITKPGWPLHSEVECEICDCQWNIDVGDLARCVHDPEAMTLTVDVDCPGCSTRYTALKHVGTPRTPTWKMADASEQYNLETTTEMSVEEGAKRTLDIAGIHDVSTGKLFGHDAFAPAGHVHGDPAHFHAMQINNTPAMQINNTPAMQGPAEQAYSGATDHLAANAKKGEVPA